MKLFVLLFFLSFSAMANFDYEIGAEARSYPLSAISKFDLGYNQLLWGDTQNISYGFIRPNLTLEEIGTYHAGTIAVDLHPISFLELRGGLSREITNSKRTDIDCNQYECQGKINHKFFETSLLLGYRTYFSSLRYRLNSSSRKDGTHPFLEYDTMIPMQARHDHSQLFQIAVGKSINNKWNAILASQLASSSYAHGSSTAYYAMAMYSQNSWEIIFGPGAFRSSLLPWNFSAILSLSWKGKDSLELKQRD